MSRYGQAQLQTRLSQAHNHFSHYHHYFGQLQPLGAQYPLLNDYLSSCLLTFIAGTILYLVCTTISYLLIYVINSEKLIPFFQQKKEYQENILSDIKWSLINILGQTPLVTLIKTLYPYYSVVQYTWSGGFHIIAYLLLHILYDEFLTYWAHRLLHHPSIYYRLHYIHHLSKTVTPFSGFAFHPLDAFLQAVPVFTSCYLIPIPLDIVLLHGIITSLWAISIHDNLNIVTFKGILYAGSHTIHHKPWGINFNYGKILSVCDRLYGTYCDPSGITQYGYEQSETSKKIFNYFNGWLEIIVPDMGRRGEVRLKNSIAFRKILEDRYGKPKL